MKCRHCGKASEGMLHTFCDTCWAAREAICLLTWAATESIIRELHLEEWEAKR